MAKTKLKTVYTCQNCGAQRSRWEGKCSDCGSWNSFVEETLKSESSAGSHRGWSTAASTSITLDQDLELAKMKRWSTGFTEFDRVLGGGLAQGSFVLLGGSPGIGKSTILMQMSGGLGNGNTNVLYISGEESVSQTAHRAHRLGIRSPRVEIAAESNLDAILALAETKKPHVLVVDSIQTVFLPELQSAPGSVSQVRECAGRLMSLAKQKGITVFLIGHVTKDGSIAGPKVLEHMVDTVLSFEGDSNSHFRMLRSIKNRFGGANELGVFQMVSSGLEEVLNPSELFLQERGEQLVGSVVFASVEGSRPLLCEIQALTLESPTAMPRRTALGVDPNRLHLIAAVLERHLEIQLNRNDIYINVVGGLRIEEPAVDLAMAAALLSSEGRQEIDPAWCFFGEIGLTGEIRGVTFPDMRIKEADKLGFHTFFVPESNRRALSEFNLPKNKKIIFLKHLSELQKSLKSPLKNQKATQQPEPSKDLNF
ncbi:MAG: DNA repair protein RadA [Bdellovibrionota bacterium]